MKYTTFIILYSANYCQKISSYFDVEELIKAGIEVEFWDLSSITTRECLSPVKTIGLKEVKIRSNKELTINIKRLSNKKCLYMSFLNFALYSYKIYRLLSKYDVDILYATSGTLPVEPINNSRKVKKLFKEFPIKSIFKSIFLRVIVKFPFFKPAKFVLMSCNHASCDYKVSQSTEYVSCNSGDFNDYKRTKKEKEKCEIVFIDQYTPFHNDFILRGLRQIPADRYYASLNSFFTKIEDKYRCDVVICAHPSAIKYKEKDFFNGRKVVYNETANEIKKALGVFTHFSTAISFPIMEEIPIILITTDDMNRFNSQFASFEKYLSNLLNLPMINIDHCEDCEFKQIDKDAYRKYLWDYLTTPKMYNKSNSDVLISIANGNYKQFMFE